jgi:hypothetical protein
LTGNFLVSFINLKMYYAVQSHKETIVFKECCNESYCSRRCLIGNMGIKSRQQGSGRGSSEP